MRRSVRLAALAIFLVTALALVACGHKNPAAPAPAGAVVGDPARASRASLGPDGGTLTATGSDGTEYVLEVPTGALYDVVTITMTPILSIRGLPLSGGLAGAVELRPSGLHFARRALLRIRNGSLPGPGQRRIGFSSTSDADTFSVALTASGAGEVDVFVSHFSTAGAGFGTIADLGSFTPTASGALHPDGILALDLPADRAAAVQILKDDYQNVVRPGLQDAHTDGELVIAVADYEAWRDMIDLVALDGNPGLQPLPVPGAPPAAALHETIPEVSAELDDAASIAAAAIVTAIAGNNALCASQASLIPLRNMLFWQHQAALFGVADAAHGLDVPSVLEDLCAHAELISQNLPASVTVGFPHSLDVTFGIRFGNGTLLPERFDVHLTATNLDLQHPDGFTDGVGLYTTVATAPGTGPIEVSAHVCLVLPGSNLPSPICWDLPVAGSTGSPAEGFDMTGDWTIRIAVLCGSGAEFATAPIHLTQTANAVSGSFTDGAFNCLCFCLEKLSGTFSATVTTDDHGAPLLVGLSVDPTIDATATHHGTCNDAIIQVAEAHPLTPQNLSFTGACDIASECFAFSYKGITLTRVSPAQTAANSKEVTIAHGSPAQTAANSKEVALAHGSPARTAAMSQLMRVR
jgi:hypothetical protein